MVCRSVSPLGAAGSTGWRDSARVAETRGMEHLPSDFHGVGAPVGEGWFSLCLPDPFLPPPAVANPSQTFHLSQFSRVCHILLPFPPFHLLPLAPSHFFLVSSLLPPSWVLPSAVLPARSRHPGHGLCVISAPHLLPLGSLQALLKLPLCIKDI